MSDIVKYDRVASWDGAPYRSAALYKQDAANVVRSGPGTKVQVIAEHGDTTWTNATYVRFDTIESAGIIRFYVIIDDGPKRQEWRVAEDRIRVKP